MTRKEGNMSLRPTKARLTAALAGVVGLTLTGALAACGGDDGDTGGNAGGSDCAQYTQYGDLKGKTISIYTGIVTPEDQPQIDSYKPFERCTGATVKYEGDKAFETQIVVRAKAGNAPDLAIVPQPG